MMSVIASWLSDSIENWYINLTKDFIYSEMLYPRTTSGSLWCFWAPEFKWEKDILQKAHQKTLSICHTVKGWESCGFSDWRIKAKAQINNFYKYLLRESKEGGARIFFKWCSAHEKESLATSWNCSSKGVVQSPSLDTVKIGRCAK